MEKKKQTRLRRERETETLDLGFQREKVAILAAVGVYGVFLFDFLTV